MKFFLDGRNFVTLHHSFPFSDCSQVWIVELMALFYDRLTIS